MMSIDLINLPATPSKNMAAIILIDDISKFMTALASYLLKINLLHELAKILKYLI